jgi:hypothetical protein
VKKIPNVSYFLNASMILVNKRNDFYFVIQIRTNSNQRIEKFQIKIYVFDKDLFQIFLFKNKPKLHM